MRLDSWHPICHKYNVFNLNYNAAPKIYEYNFPTLRYSMTVIHNTRNQASMLLKPSLAAREQSKFSLWMLE